MRLCAWAVVCLAVSCLGEEAALKLPAWLKAFPGGVPQVTSQADLLESRYSVKVTPDKVIAHYQHLFETASVPFTPNVDGIGTSVRASVPECDLLIKVRESGDGSAVQVDCSPKSSGAAPIQVVGSPSRQPRTVEEMRRQQDEHTKRVLAQAEADHQRRINDMAKYDKPVYGGSTGHSSFYNDDAPPLVWPAWFVSESGQALPAASKGVDGQSPYLRRRYRTTAPMTKLYEFYEALFKANGMSLGPARLSTGQTITGNVHQNKWGYIEASCSEDGAVNGPHTHVKADFNRNYLNEPITVTLTVTVRGSFGRR
jgi:hypothetical protein